ncbi:MULTISPECIES: flagellar hook-length control protein FliK [Paenibacillus]|uniref:Flagellar hook-length control protein-like C-terminal domain-containing protein n=1 Tax=Paenibacillus albilobatus TaxID=2716884 RepID=A0A919XE49_9BACL|nr:MULTISPECIES: flagellar hook-length control protein FliK [Paenibacillus]GIO29999.1 hypothetical protein J2TS6_11400 [Paenibacillus albilobatus]
MSLIFQNIAGGNAASGKTAAAGGKQAAGAGAVAGMFDQSLAQMMTGEGAQQNAAAIMNAGTLLEGLLKLAGLSAASDESGIGGQNAADLLQSLIGDADKLDEAVAADPELLAALQGWLQQVQNLLNQANPAGNAATPDQADVLTGPLSESPATIRFVVQEGMAQLAVLLQKPDGNVGKVQHQALQLLQSFQELVKDATSAQPKPTDAVALTQLHKNATAETNIGAWLKSGQSAGDEPTRSGDQEQPHDLFAAQHTVTAGQLALRHGINASAKAAAPVPVEKFSEEMSGFVVKNLEFVKQQGMTEARITLYPERLGQVDVKLTMQNGQLIAQFSTEHAATKDLLEQQMSQLRSSLQTQGVQVEKLVVTQNQSPQSQMYQDGGRQPGAGQQQSNRRSKEKEAPTDDALKIAEMGEELNEWLAAQEEANGGNMFTAKA